MWLKIIMILMKKVINKIAISVLIFGLPISLLAQSKNNISRIDLNIDTDVAKVLSKLSYDNLENQKKYIYSEDRLIWTENVFSGKPAWFISISLLNLEENTCQNFIEIINSNLVSKDNIYLYQCDSKMHVFLKGKKNNPGSIQADYMSYIQVISVDRLYSVWITVSLFNCKFLAKEEMSTFLNRFKGIRIIAKVE